MGPVCRLAIAAGALHIFIGGCGHSPGQRRIDAFIGSIHTAKVKEVAFRKRDGSSAESIATPSPSWEIEFRKALEAAMIAEMRAGPRELTNCAPSSDVVVRLRGGGDDVDLHFDTGCHTFGATPPGAWEAPYHQYQYSRSTKIQDCFRELMPNR